MSVIFIKINESDKLELEKAAKKLGMPVTTYCRMLLIKSLGERDGSS